jgi:photosystem II stability/assembly factor-like uncharacterized protein
MSHHQRFGFGRIGIILTILMTLLTISVHAQEAGFTETFDDPTLPGWNHSPGVQVIDGVLLIEPGNFANRSGEWGGDMSLNIAIRRIGSGDFVVSYQASQNGAYHLLVVETSIALQRENGESFETLVTADAPPIPAGEWFQIDVVVTGDEHLILFNGDPGLRTVSEPSALPPGGIVIETHGEASVEVSSLVLTLPNQTEGPDHPASTADSTDPGDSSTISAAGLPTFPWVYTGGPSGGLGYDIRMDPRDPDVMYVTDALAGAFKSKDGGENWFPINNGITARVGLSGDAIPVFSLSIDPNNPDTLWAGTTLGGGAFRSDNAGESWQRLNNGILERELTIRGFTVEPGNSDVVYMAGEISSWEWNNGPLKWGLVFDMTKGVVYKTTDGGQNWLRIWIGDNLARYIWIHPQDHDLLYVSTGIFDREAANSNPSELEPGGIGILRSKDGGVTWQTLGVENGFLPEDLFFGSIAMHPQNPQILFGATGNDAYLWALNRPIGAIYQTEDGGNSWQRVLDLDNASAVEICESNPDVIYAGSGSLIYRSDDGGDTWQNTSSSQVEGQGFWGPVDIVAGFPIDMQCDPRDPMRIFVNNYGGGNFLSVDGGQTWNDSSKGYTGAIMHQVIVAPETPALVYASARSGLFKSRDGGENWEGMARGAARGMEALSIALDPQDSLHVIAVATDAGPAPKITYDGGQTWHEATTNFSGSGQLAWGWEVMKKMAFSPAQPGVVIGIEGENMCGGMDAPCDEGMGVIFSSDGGETWRLSNLSDGMATELAFAPDGSAYVAVYPGDLYRSSDGGDNWDLVAQNITSGIVTENWDPDTRVPAMIALSADPYKPFKLYAGFSKGGVMVSEDGGVNWRASSAGMVPEAAIFDLIADAAHPGVIYAASADSGVYISMDSGATWRAINDGLFQRSGISLSLSSDGDVLYLATNGGGVFRLGTPASVEIAPTEEQPPASVEIAPTEEQPTEVALDEADPQTTLPEIEEPFERSDLLIGVGIGVAVTGIVVLVVVMMRRRKAAKG